MDSDKIYMWLTILTFVGFLTAVIFINLDVYEYKDQSQGLTVTSPFK